MQYGKWAYFILFAARQQGNIWRQIYFFPFWLKPEESLTFSVTLTSYLTLLLLLSFWPKGQLACKSPWIFHTYKKIYTATDVDTCPDWSQHTQTHTPASWDNPRCHGNGPPGGHECPYIAKTHRDKEICECGHNVSTVCWRLNSCYWQDPRRTKLLLHTNTSEEVPGKNRKLDHTPERATEQKAGRKEGRKAWKRTHTFCLFVSLTLTPSILNPRVAVELMVSLHCMYLGLVTAFLSFSSVVGAPGSTSTIFWYMSGLGEGFFRALVSSSSK